MSDAPRIPALEVSEAFVLSKIQFLMDVHLWPDRQILDAASWLRNFTNSERPYALHMLNVFVYYSEPMVDALLRASVQALSARISARATSLSDAMASWRRFLGSSKFSYVEGEKPSPTDSGLLFARKARQVLYIDEEQIVSPADALKEIAINPDVPVLLLDDFVGAGMQMSGTWIRPYDLGAGRRGSFVDAASKGANIAYTPLIATAYGLGELARVYPELHVFPAHVMGNRYSLADPQSTLWPDALRPSAAGVLFEASRRAGIVDDYEYGWKGFRDLSLPLAFYHSVPDATLPLFFWDQKGWAPLIRRT
jgi:hypothetical protein